MKIIDAHFHLFPDSDVSREMLEHIEHKPGRDALLEEYDRLGIVHGVVMGNHSLNPADHVYPQQMHYCVGLDSFTLSHSELESAPVQVEENLRRPQCCGIKLYPGYNTTPLTDPAYEPIYQLAEQYGKPVAIHMGQTAMSRAKLKYSHPLALDEVATDHPYVQFVMCHFGNPFLPDAAGVVEKNPNVAADLSGLLDDTTDAGVTNLAIYRREQVFYMDILKGWVAYGGDWSKFMFGTDFPAVNVENYIQFIKEIIPQRHWDEVFFQNANRIYGLGLCAAES